jgi:hypothetical protein
MDHFGGLDVSVKETSVAPARLNLPTSSEQRSLRQQPGAIFCMRMVG